MVRASGEAIEIVVSDDGVGMYKEQIDTWSRTFEIPDRGAGSGIGLSNVNRRLIRQFGETLRIAARPGGGTVVTMPIPILHEEDHGQR
ncbi:sensor histidine kinase [Paenibacillus mendelii]|uniref:sensor histidine kinase n=1 Tax=Paenibacillus mendelii TaxID=206163 RepID=UPI00359C2570